MTAFKLRLRKINQRIVGATIPAAIVNEFDLGAGDEILVDINSVIRQTVEYICGICQCSFTENSDETEIECHGCGEKNHIIRIEDDFEHLNLKDMEDYTDDKQLKGGIK